MKKLISTIFFIFPMVALATNEVPVGTSTPQARDNERGQASSLSREVTFDIPAQPLNTALLAFSAQTGLQILTSGAALPTQNANAINGKQTIDTALQQLLNGTGLKYQTIGQTTITLMPLTLNTGNKGEGNTGNLRVAQNTGNTGEAQENSTTSSNETNENSTSTDPDTDQGDRKGIPEILVKGSRLLNMDIRRTRDDTQPYVVFEREAIERSGFRNIEEFLKYRLTSVNGTVSLNQLPSGSNRSAINLRGLGPAQTLILVDGHRRASIGTSGSPTQSDLNGIPLSAIERIEVLPVTASGIYGGSATGGAINVILRRDYSGVETRLAYSNSVDGGGSERRVEMNAGFGLEGGKTNILLAGAYSETSPLLVRDRNFVQRGRELILRNNPAALLNGFAPPLGATTNICSSFFGFCASAFGIDIPLALNDGTSLGSSFTSVSAGSVVDSDAELLANAGQYNLQLANTTQGSGGKNQALLNAPQVKSFIATLRREFTPRIQAFLDLSASENASSFTTNNISGTFSIPRGAAANPFDQDIVVTTPALGIDRTATSTNQDRRAVIGMIFKLSDVWQAEIDYTWNRTKLSGLSAVTSLTADATTAVRTGVTGNGTAFSIFRDTNLFPVDFSPYVGQPTVVSPSTTTLGDLAIRVSGRIPFSLPAGSPTLTFLAEHRKESLSDYVLSSPTFLIKSYSRSQSIDSVYLETQLPLISDQNRIPGVHSLDLTFAARRDRYSLAGANTAVGFAGSPLASRITAEREVSSTDPTVGLRYEPTPDVTLRASYSTGFLPPEMALLVPGIPFPTNGATYGGLTDPLRGGEAIGGFDLIIGGNPNLRSEQSRSWSAGVIVTPRFAPQLRLAIDGIKIEKYDNIVGSVPLSQNTINNESLFPGVIVRGPKPGLSCDPFCPIVEFRGGATNISQQTVEAYDLSLDYRLETNGRGALTFSSAATRNVRSSTQRYPTSAVLDGVGLFGALKWQMNAALTWEYQQWAVQWATRYFDSYYFLSDRSVLPNQGAAAVPTQTYHDASVTYRFNDLTRAALLKDSEIQVVVTNVFNKKPPIDLSLPSLFYSSLGDPRLANYSISLRKAFH